MDLRAYLGGVANQLVNELTPILAVKEVTTNTDLLGKYTEASVRNLVRRVVHPMYVSTGAVLDHPVPPSLRQIDLIIWAPFPVPAVFEVDGFGLVPKSSAFGVIEVKRSNYSTATSQIEEFLAGVDSRAIVADYDPHVSSFRDAAMSPGVAVICVLDSAPSKRLAKLLSTGRVFAIFERDAHGKTVVRPRDVLALVNFLHFVTWRYRSSGANSTFPQVNLAAFE